MIFSLKSKYSVTEEKIKKDITDNGKIIVKLNLRYPLIKCNANDPLSFNAAPFYKRIAESFAFFAEKTLAHSAKNYANDAELPLSAVMQWFLTFENEKFLSFVLDFSYSDEYGIQKRERKTQIWERKFGTLCRFSYFFPKERKLPELQHINEKLFFLTESGYGFYVPENNEYKSVLIPFDENDKKIVL